MNIRGRHLGEYVPIIGKPLLACAALFLFSFIASFLFFDLYALVGSISLFVYVGFGLHIGSKAKNMEFDSVDIFIAGLIFGVIVGIMGGIENAALIIGNESVVNLYDETIKEAIERSEDDVVREDVVLALAFWSVVMWPIVWGIILGISSVFGSIGAGYLKRRNQYAPEPEEDEGPDTKIRKRANKKFRRRK